MKSEKKKALKKGVPEPIANKAWIAKAEIIINSQGMIILHFMNNFSDADNSEDQDGFKPVPHHRAAKRRGT